MILVEDVLPATSTIATGSFPYYSEGPIDFRNENFVHTCETDYYYDASSSLLISEVQQCVSTVGTFWTIIGITAIFIAMLYGGTYMIAKRYSHKK